MCTQELMGSSFVPLPQTGRPCTDSSLDDLPVFKVTPSSLSFLREQCPLCFWRKCRGQRILSSPMAGVFNRLDRLMKTLAESEQAQVVRGLAAGPSRVITDVPMLETRPLEVPGRRCRIIFRGQPDCVVEGRSNLVLDFKTTTPTALTFERYLPSLIAYVILLREHTSDRLPRFRCSRAGVLCWSPSRVEPVLGPTHAVTGPMVAILRQVTMRMQVELLQSLADELLGEEPERGEGCPYDHSR